MSVDLHNALFEASPTLYVVVGVYLIVGAYWFFFGWWLLRKMGERLQAESKEFDDFVTYYLLGRGMFFRLQSTWLKAAIAAGVIHRSFWGRSFRNLEPSEAQRISSSFSMTRFEQILSRFMLVHSWIMVTGLAFGFVLEATGWITHWLL
ncbi:MAG: hypothetical protein JJU06_03710 [Ectothiorhodospiraceae bacterium]|nr:hypothetical protein [Ectothiorhodospiraceae bacterium]